MHSLFCHTPIFINFCINIAGNNGNAELFCHVTLLKEQFLGLVTSKIPILPDGIEAKNQPRARSDKKCTPFQKTNYYVFCLCAERMEDRRGFY